MGRLLEVVHLSPAAPNKIGKQAVVDRNLPDVFLGRALIVGDKPAEGISEVGWQRRFRALSVFTAPDYRWCPPAAAAPGQTERRRRSFRCFSSIAL